MQPRRRERYYVPKPPPTVAAPPEPLIGAKAIAEELKLTPSQVYKLVHGDPRRQRKPEEVPPIVNRPGLGLCADRATLRAWWCWYLGAAA